MFAEHLPPEQHGAAPTSEIEKVTLLELVIFTFSISAMAKRARVMNVHPAHTVPAKKVLRAQQSTIVSKVTETAQLIKHLLPSVYTVVKWSHTDSDKCADSAATSSRFSFADKVDAWRFAVARNILSLLTHETPVQDEDDLQDGELLGNALLGADFERPSGSPSKTWLPALTRFVATWREARVWAAYAQSVKAMSARCGRWTMHASLELWIVSRTELVIH